MIPASKHKQVLVADDDIDLREIIAFIMEKKGFEVSEANDGQMAFNTIISHNMSHDMFNFLITDYEMPEIDGIKLIKALKNRGISLPTIVMSGECDRDIIDQLKGLNYVHFLKKPFKIMELLKEVALVEGDIEKNEIE